jgi:ABC-type Na+ transport system ATPase subunit NatA
MNFNMLYINKNTFHFFILFLYESILMTNQLQFLSTADNVILLNEGEIVTQGRYDELKERGFKQLFFILSDIYIYIIYVCYIY